MSPSIREESESAERHDGTNGTGVPLRVLDVPIEGMAAPGAVIESASADVTVLPQELAPLVGLLYPLLWAPGVVTTLLALFTVVRALSRLDPGHRLGPEQTPGPPRLREQRWMKERRP
ncbi:hypothetical protein GCM10009733_023150 [Nonomuraea maheshkhaliensis]|uniref:Uncharacterized protein n=1 Tax=Nonomuraea maheshkhaliensis TaxID=419590 RepID=A0ABN2F161_9ACTN